MRRLLIGLMVFVVALGASCKKEEVNLDGKAKAKTEIQKDLKAPAKPGTLALENPGDGGGIGGYPGGADTYPHNTGACYCGYYAVCHPQQYYTWEATSGGEATHLVPHLTKPGQTTFPDGAVFQGNPVY